MKKLLLPIIAFVLVLSSCTDDLTSLNEDPKGANDVPAEPLFSNALVSLGTLNTTPDYNINMFKFMAQYWSATTYADESQYDLRGRAIPDSYWSEIYRDVLNDLEESSALVAEDHSTQVISPQTLPDAVKQNMQAQIEIVNVMAYYQLVTVFGNIPYDEALDSDNPAPSYDDAETIFNNLMGRLDTAIGNLDISAGGFGASSDIFYGGNVEAWHKFANALKMRMAITLADYAPGTAETALDEASPNAFDSNADNLTINFSSTPPHTNPIWESLVQSGRNDFVPSNTLIDMMNNLNDPRRPIHFTLYDTDDDGTPDAYHGGPYGASNTYSQFSHIQGPVIADDFEGMLLGYDEVELIRAEAAARGWTVSGVGAAEDHYNNAIEADMDYWSNAALVAGAGTWDQEPSEADKDITPAEITAYQTQTDVLYPTTGTEEEQLKAIAEQKWLALYLQGLQAWTDWRRLDHPTWYTDDNPAADTEDDIPSRFLYPIDEQNLNEENWNEASTAIGGDEMTTKLFWDTFDATRW